MSGEPNDAVMEKKENVAIAKNALEKSVESALIKEPTVAPTTEVVKANVDVKPVQENGSVTATEDGPNSVCVASAC